MLEISQHLMKLRYDKILVAYFFDHPVHDHVLNSQQAL